MKGAEGVAGAEENGAANTLLMTEERVRKFLLSFFFIAFSLPIAFQQTLLGCLLAFLGYMGWRNRGLPATPLDPPLLGCVVALLLSSLFCPALWSSLIGLRKLWLVGAFFVVYHFIADPRELWKLISLMVVTAVGVAIYSVLQHYTGIDVDNWLRGKPANLTRFWFGRAEGFRAQGLFPSGITYAHNLSFPLTMLTVWFVAQKLTWSKRASLFAGWGCMVFALLFSLTRGVWLAYLIVLGGLAVVKGARSALTIAAGIVLLGAALLVSSPGVRERAAYMFDINTNLPRSQIWLANLDMIKERPLLGWGYGNYKRFRDPYYQRHPQVDTTAHAHNNFLQMWVDIGLVGLTAFLWLFWSILSRGWRAYQQLALSAFCSGD
jgi:O-antigen ligase